MHRPPSSRIALWAGLLVGLALLVSPAALPAAEDDDGLPGLDGGRLKTADLAEGSTIIVVWASWSPRSRDIGERVAAIAERWGGRARVMTVNFQESPDKARAFAREQRIKVPVYLDRDATFAKRHAVTSLPFMVIFVDGKSRFAGKLPADADAVIGRSIE